MEDSAILSRFLYKVHQVKCVKADPDFHPLINAMLILLNAHGICKMTEEQLRAQLQEYISNNIQNISSDESDRSTEPEYISTLKSSDDFKLILATSHVYEVDIGIVFQDGPEEIVQVAGTGGRRIIILGYTTNQVCLPLFSEKDSRRLVRMPSECNQGKVSDKTVTLFLNVAVSNILEHFRDYFVSGGFIRIQLKRYLAEV